MQESCRAWRRALQVALVLYSSCTFGCAAGSDRPGDILLITVDTLRADHMDCYGYVRKTTPQLSRFFASGTVFERSYATSSFTTASMISALSGVLPQEHGVRLFNQLLPGQCSLITEMLPDTYQTAAFVSNGVLSDRAMGIAARFDHFDDRMEWRHDTYRLERGAHATTEAAIDWLRRERDPDRPLFLWVHYMDPHEPYDPPEQWRSTFDREVEGDAAPKPLVWEQTPEAAFDPLQRIDDYDREIAYADAEIGRLLAAYGALWRLDDALILFTADHGETLVERQPSFQHAYTVFEEIVLVPLMIRGPGVTEGRSAALVSALDLVPTMLAFAGAEVPRNLAGRDLRSPADAAGRTSVFVESINRLDRSQWRAVVTQAGKWAVRIRGRKSRILEKGFWDLATDPGEANTLPWRDEGPAKQLLELVEMDPDPAGRPTDHRKGLLVKDQRDALRALGYGE